MGRKARSMGRRSRKGRKGRRGCPKQTFIPHGYEGEAMKQPTADDILELYNEWAEKRRGDGLPASQRIWAEWNMLTLNGMQKILAQDRKPSRAVLLLMLLNSRLYEISKRIIPMIYFHLGQDKELE